MLKFQTITVYHTALLISRKKQYAFTKNSKFVILSRITLIKRDGGTGPMKSGNRHRRCQFLQILYLADERKPTIKALSFGKESFFVTRKDE
jgi:hypothetical protein